MGVWAERVMGMLGRLGSTKTARTEEQQQTRSELAREAWRVFMSREARSFPMETEYALEEGLLEPPPVEGLDDDLPPGWRWSPDGLHPMTPEEAAEHDREFSLLVNTIADVAEGV